MSGLEAQTGDGLMNNREYAYALTRIHLWPDVRSGDFGSSSHRGAQLAIRVAELPAIVVP
jgi:hypothetical protein